MALPSISIVFKTLASQGIQQGQVGKVVLALKDASVTTGVVEHRLFGITEIPTTLSTSNKDLIKLAFQGTPKEVGLVVIAESAVYYTAALDYAESIRFNVFAIPGIVEADIATVGTWVKDQFDNKGKKFLAVLPSHEGDHPAIVNFDTDDIKVGETAYTVTQYSARIAGLLAGLPLTVAPTYQVLSDVTDIPRIKKADADTAIDEGKLILWHDGEKVKIASGVTSYITVTGDRGEDWKKIKLVRIYNKIYDDIRTTIENFYIGRVQNSYANKLSLVASIRSYFNELENQEILDTGKNSIDIDVDAQRNYLNSIGTNTSGWTEGQIREANTRDKVFLQANIRALDGMENFTINIYT
ncbi:phage tail sheath C-terminal domain-containing protein [Paenibacillus spongiae]|uniref:Phage tail sheath subtilisin-like domain-containing protein n=1 Tax=Paenibacillus spongiae TaxID=2909671 RepID=A0ABY5SDQ5_9BACL|nr:phage tail sheath C-terminal domain-containing protein [Paenibacillus spongiae]UVI32087.1 phage tail sheath subtilisin-like domain-containing protein [Paenibacillus spongiae]